MLVVEHRPEDGEPLPQGGRAEIQDHDGLGERLEADVGPDPARPHFRSLAPQALRIAIGAAIAAANLSRRGPWVSVWRIRMGTTPRRTP